MQTEKVVNNKVKSTKNHSCMKKTYETKFPKFEFGACTMKLFVLFIMVFTTYESFSYTLSNFRVKSFTNILYVCAKTTMMFVKY